MSIYLFLYIFTIFLLFYIWLKLFRSHWKYVYWKYITISLFSYWFWLLLYLLSFTTTYDSDILLILSRLMYTLALIWMYWILFFVINFSKKSKSLFKESNTYVMIVFILFFVIWVFSKNIISEMIFDDTLWIYYEWYGPLYLIYVLLYLLYVPLFILFTYLTLKKLHTINKIRFKYISFWYLIFVLNQVIFLAILPLLWIWVLQKEQVVFFIPFIFWLLYSIHRYYFSDLRIWLWKLLYWILSLSLSILIVIVLKAYYLKLSYTHISFWWFSSNFWIIDLTIWIILFIFINNLLDKILPVSSKLDNFSFKISRIKKEIPFITNISDLNKYLKVKFKKSFSINWVKLEVRKNNSRKKNTYNFFDKYKSDNIFINDLVFLEENKYKYNLSKIKNEFWKNDYLIFPIKNSSESVVWLLILWNRLFKDSYYSEEIKIILDFVHFLEWHLKYIDIYKKINDLNVNLDKKVDEKTIEYNTLINKQKDFIALLSHEVKNPIAWAIFQLDSVIDDVKTWNTKKEYIENELDILSRQLIKAWDLLNKLFTIEQYDINKFKLFKEETDVRYFLNEELEIFENVNPWVKLVKKFSKETCVLNIDRIQFRQVFDNLLNNSLKHCNRKECIIAVSYTKIWWINTIYIEDNWKWFDTDNLFDKYSTWESSSIWLWMGLYLCKKIVELHSWKIVAVKSKKYWWAKFVINL